MWNIKHHMQKDEQIRYIRTPEWIGYYIGFIIVLISLIPIIISIWFVMIPLAIIFIISLKKYSTKYIISNKRVAGRYGIISEDFKSATFKHITSIRVKQGIIGKIFNFGNLTIDTAGSGEGVDFVWKYVKNPIGVKNLIEKHIA